MNSHSLLVPVKDDEILTFVKTPGMARAAAISLPPAATVGESIQRLQSRSIKTDEDRRFVEHLRRETSGPHNFFALTHGSQLIEVKPQTRLADLAIPRELHFPEGPRHVPCVAVEVVQYASVGLGS
jgi:hypothetical protein